MKRLVLVMVWCFVGMAYAANQDSTQNKKCQCDLTIQKESMAIWAQVNFKNISDEPVGLYLNSYFGEGEVEDTVFDVMDLLKEGYLRLGHRGKLKSNRPWGSHLVFVQPGKSLSFKVDLRRCYSFDKSAYKISYVSSLYRSQEKGFLYQVRSNAVTVNLK